MEIRVSPNRMQLLHTRKRLVMARRGHKLLKDKRDELMRRFMELVERNKDLRIEVEEGLSVAFSELLKARMETSAIRVEEAIMFPKERFSVSATEGSIVGVKVPKFEVERSEGGRSGIYPYGLANTDYQLDTAIKRLSDTVPKMLELAEVEKSTELLAAEIEKTRRRVNALEHVLIPKLEDSIKYITMKLDETERGNLTRLMKVKEMVQQRGV